VIEFLQIYRGPVEGSRVWEQAYPNTVSMPLHKLKAGTLENKHTKFIYKLQEK
jgi:hypothetical protein